VLEKDLVAVGVIQDMSKSSSKGWLEPGPLSAGGPGVLISSLLPLRPRFRRALCKSPLRRSPAAFISSFTVCCVSSGASVAAAWYESGDDLKGGPYRRGNCGIAEVKEGSNEVGVGLGKVGRGKWGKGEKNRCRGEGPPFHSGVSPAEQVPNAVSKYDLLRRKT
jgi:hypothetical protein